METEIFETCFHDNHLDVAIDHLLIIIFPSLIFHLDNPMAIISYIDQFWLYWSFFFCRCILLPTTRWNKKCCTNVPAWEKKNQTNFKKWCKYSKSKINIAVINRFPDCLIYQTDWKKKCCYITLIKEGCVCLYLSWMANAHRLGSADVRCEEKSRRRAVQCRQMSFQDQLRSCPSLVRAVKVQEPFSCLSLFLKAQTLLPWAIKTMWPLFVDWRLKCLYP